MIKQEGVSNKNNDNPGEKGDFYWASNRKKAGGAAAEVYRKKMESTDQSRSDDQVNSENQEKNQDNSGNKEKKGFFASLAGAIADRMTFKGFRESLSEFRNKKDIWREEIVEKDNLEEEAWDSLNKLREKYFVEDYVLTSGQSIEEIFQRFKNKEENKSLGKDELREKWIERIKRVEEKLIEREKRRMEAKNRAEKRIKEEKGMIRAEMAIEALKSSTTWGGLVLAGGSLSGVQAGSAVAASVGFGRLTSIPADLLLRIKKEKGEGAFFDYAKEKFSAGTREFLTAFQTGTSTKERLSILGKTTGRGILGAFSVYAMARGWDRVFGDDISGVITEKTGLSSVTDKIKNWFGSTFGDHQQGDLDYENYSQKLEKIWGVDINNLHNGTAPEVNDILENPKIENLEVEVPKGQGAIKTFKLLQDKLEEQYNNGQKSVPTLVQKILSASPEDLAREYGFYNPNDVNESAVLHLGDKFTLSENGLEYVKAGGEHLILEDGKDMVSTEGQFGDKGGKMFRSGLDNSFESENVHLDSNAAKSDLANSGAYPESNFVIDSNYPKPPSPSDPAGTPDAPGENLLNEEKSSLSANEYYQKKELLKEREVLMSEIINLKKNLSGLEIDKIFALLDEDNLDDYRSLEDSLETAKQNITAKILLNPWAIDQGTIDKLGLAKYIDGSLNLGQKVSDLIEKSGADLAKIDTEQLNEYYRDDEILFGNSSNGRSFRIHYSLLGENPKIYGYNIVLENGYLRMVKIVGSLEKSGIEEYVGKGVPNNPDNLKLFINYAINGIKEFKKK